MRKSITHVLVLMLAVLAGGTSHARQVQKTEDGLELRYGIYEHHDPANGYVVVDDQAMRYDERLRMRDRNGNTVVTPGNIRIGSPVEYAYYIDHQVWYVLRIRVLDKLPAKPDEEGGDG